MSQSQVLVAKISSAMARVPPLWTAAALFAAVASAVNQAGPPALQPLSRASHRISQDHVALSPVPVAALSTATRLGSARRRERLRRLETGHGETMQGVTEKGDLQKVGDSFASLWVLVFLLCAY